MTKWLSLGVLGVLSLIAGVLLITSGYSVSTGQVLGIVGVVLILISVVAFPLAARWALFRTKGRAVLFGAGILGRIVGALLLVVVVVVGLYMVI
jgi:hypothetical protein